MSSDRNNQYSLIGNKNTFVCGSLSVMQKLLFTFLLKNRACVGGIFGGEEFKGVFWEHMGLWKWGLSSEDGLKCL